MKPGLLARLLLRLIRGPESDYLLGDLEEWRQEEARRRNDGKSPRSFTWEVFTSLLSWWRRRLEPWTAAIAGMWRGREMWTDLSVALRGIRRRPGYAMAVVGVLAAGLGAVTAVFTITDRVLLRALPHEDSDRMVVLGTTFPGREWRTDASDLQHLAGFSLLNFLDWEQAVTSLDRMGALEARSIMMPDRGDGPELVGANGVTSGLFDILNVRPALGRTFREDEYLAAAPQVAMVTYDAWQNRYGGDPEVVGRVADDGGMEIVGVLPQSFELPEAIASTAEFWMPIRTDSERYANRGRRSLIGLARLAPGTSLERAREELDAVAARSAEEYPEGNVYPDGSRFGAGANLLRRETIGGAGRPLLLFSLASFLLLGIATLNASNLILTRSLDRQGEIALRLALGAGRGRVMRLLVAESLLLSAAAGSIGIALGYAGVRVFRTLGPASIPRMTEITLDTRIVLIALGLTLLTGLLTAILPSFRLAEGRLAQRIRTSSGARATGSDWSWSVSGQVALSLLLTVAAGLLMESFARIRSFEPGFDPSSALTFQQGLKRPGTEDIPTYALWDEVMDVVSGSPGYEQVATGSNLPFQSPNWAPSVLLEGEPPDTRRSGVAGYVVSPDYFQVLGIPLLAGRVFNASDRPESPSVAVVNQEFVDRHMADRNPIGQTIRFREGETFSSLRIAGVVGNAVQSRVEEGVRAAVYVPHTQSDWPMVWVFARTSMDPLSGVADLRRSMGEVNPYIPPLRFGTMTERIRRTQVNPRFNAAVAGSFGVLALLLAAGGLYGALSFRVGRRLREIGIRMTLGAQPRSVVTMILSQGLKVTTIGIVTGLLVALVATRLLSAFLFGVGRLSPGVFVGASLTLMAVAAVASFGPARRAVRVDPVSTLEVG